MVMPFEHGARQTGGFAVGHVLGVGGENVVLMSEDRGCHASERTIFLLGRGERQHAGSELRPPPDVLHRCGNIARSLDGLQRRGHGLVLMLKPVIS
jgi:hypothetical protein